MRSLREHPALVAGDAREQPMSRGTDLAATRFLGRWPGPAPVGPRRLAALEEALRDAFERGRASWPRVSLSLERFGAWLGARAPADLPADEAVQRLRARSRRRSWAGCRDGSSSSRSAGTGSTR